MTRYLVAIFGFAAIITCIAQPADTPRQVETPEQVYHRQLAALMDNWDVYQVCVLSNPQDICIDAIADVKQPGVREYEIVR